VSAAGELVLFALGATVSLRASGLLVARLERIGARVGLSEVALGLLVALAADGPEVTSAVSALAAGNRQVGAGVVIGSNVFNLAALLGLSALVAGSVVLHRRVVLFAGSFGLAVAGTCVLAVTGVLGAPAALAVGAGVLVVHLAVLSSGSRPARSDPGPLGRWRGWLRAAVADEESELAPAVPVAPATAASFAEAGLGLLVVVAASILMERSGVGLGTRLHLPPFVVGGVVLAAVTSLPNAVSALHLARRGRAAATLATTLDSNSLNVVVGLLLPGALVGLGPPREVTVLAAAWYAGGSLLALTFAYLHCGLRRATGTVLVVAYGAFVAVVASGGGRPPAPGVIALGAAATAGAALAATVVTRGRAGRTGRRDGP